MIVTVTDKGNYVEIDRGEPSRRYVVKPFDVDICGTYTTWYIRAACPDFKQWLTNEVGSVYENNGFAQKSYYSETLKNELLQIYNGE